MKHDSASSWSQPDDRSSDAVPETAGPILVGPAEEGRGIRRALSVEHFINFGYVLRQLVVTQAYEFRVAPMIHVLPVRVFDLRDKLRLQPVAFGRLLVSAKRVAVAVSRRILRKNALKL